MRKNFSKGLVVTTMVMSLLMSSMTMAAGNISD